MAERPYRKAIVAVFKREDGKVLLGKRSDTGSWQFPQGGIDSEESPVQALYREMLEEIGCEGFEIIKESQSEFTYDFPTSLKAKIVKNYKGQSQRWFLCSFKPGMSHDLQKATCDEFVELEWFEPSFALKSIVEWKKESYKKAMKELDVL